MKRPGQRTTGLILCGLLTLAACADAFGQEPRGGGPPPGGPRRGEQGPPPEGHRPPPPPQGPVADILSSEMRFGDRPVKGAPYSAQFETESTRLLSDGTRITRKSAGAVYRNSAGQTRREITLASVGPVSVEGEPAQLVFINDPAARAHYVLDVNRRTVRELPLPDPSTPVSVRVIQGADGEDALKVERLGKRFIEGVEVDGMRSTITVPAGRVGNDRPLEFVTERWYSRELQLSLLVIHKDPYVGDNVYRMTNVSRSEPPASLFSVPHDYAPVEVPPKRPEE